MSSALTDRPTRDWPALLGAGHPLAKPGALVLDEYMLDEHGIEVWEHESELAIEFADGKGVRADMGEDAPSRNTWFNTPFAALTELRERLLAKARRLTDRAAICGGEP